MVAWFIIAIGALVFFSYVTVNVVQGLSVASDGHARIETVRRLDEAVHALLARAASPDGDGVMYLPIGSASANGQGYGLPVDIGVQAQTPFGKKLVYCPFGNVGGAGTGLTIRSPNGTSYSVTTKSLEGKTYVVGGRPTASIPAVAANNDPNLIGFVMAPRSKLSAMPSCNQIIYQASTGKYEAQDAIVRAITRNGGVDEARTVDARRLVFFVSPNGNGRGASVTDPTSLSSALNFYRTRLPASMTINMAAGNYGVGPNDLNIGYQTNNFQSNLTINGVAGATFVDMSTQGLIQIPGNLVITGTTFDQDTNIKVPSGYKLTMHNSSVGAISANGDVTLDGQNALSQSRNDWSLGVMNGSKVYVGGTLNVYAPYGKGILVFGDGVLTATSAQINFNTANSSRFGTGVALQTGGTATFNGTVLNYPVGVQAGIQSQGLVSLENSAMQFGGATSNISIATLEGSRLGIVGSIIGSGVRPATGIYDQGSAQVYGGTSQIAGVSACWAGPQFADSQVPANGVSSAVLADVAVTALPASPTPAQIQAYSDSRAVNARRDVRRTTNRSSWTCLM